MVTPWLFAILQGLQRTVQNLPPTPVRWKRSSGSHVPQSRHQRSPICAASHSRQVGDFCLPPRKFHEASSTSQETQPIGAWPRFSEARAESAALQMLLMPIGLLVTVKAERGCGDWCTSHHPMSGFSSRHCWHVEGAFPLVARGCLISRSGLR